MIFDPGDTRHFPAPAPRLDDTTRNMLADMDPGCDHEWCYGECQRCGETHPEDCLGCAPLSHATDEHPYLAPDPDAVEWAQHLADEQAHAEGDDGPGY